MPNSLKIMKSRRWKWLKQARKIVFWVPVLTLILGIFITLTIYKYLNQQELNYRKQDSYQQAHEAVSQIDLQLSNSILRVQTYEDYVSGYGRSQISKAYISQALEYTVFHRLSTFKDVSTKKRPNAYKLVMRINKKLSELPIPLKNDYMSTPELIDSIQQLIKNSAYHVPIVFESQGVIRFAVLMRSKIRKDIYFLFSAPLLSVFNKIDFGGISNVIVYDVYKKNQWMITQQDNKKIVRKVNPNDAQLSKDYFEFNFNKDLPQSGLSLGLKFSYVQAASPLVSTSRIIALLSLMLTIIISYLFYVLITSNRNANRLIINKTIDLEKTAHDLQVALNGKSRFLGKISHEIRTPLNLILGMIDLCTESAVDPKLQNYLKSMRSSGDHLLTMIDDLLELSKAESNDLSYEGKKTYLIQFLSDVTKLISADCRSKKLFLYTYFDPELPGKIICDPNRLRQVLLNLLRNAFKYTNSGYIQLNVSLISPMANNRAKIRFEVKDTGIGIPADKINKVFDAFFQVENSNIYADGGVGLGLSIVKDIVKKMNGHVHVISDPKTGTLFHVDLDFEVEDDITWLNGYKLENDLQKNVFVVSTNPQFQKSYSSLAKHPKISLDIISPKDFSEIPLEKLLSKNSYVILDMLTCGLYLQKLQELSKDKFIIPVGPLISRTGTKADSILVNVDDIPLLAHETLNAIGFSSRSQNRNLVKSVPVYEVKNNVEALVKKKLNLIVADDDIGNIELYKAYFDNLDWNIQYAENGAEAWEYYNTQKPDLMIIDVRMPVMDGFQLVEKVRSHESTSTAKTVPIILATADLMEVTVERSKEFKMVYFLSKPIKKSVLLEKIEASLPVQTL